MGKNDFGTFKKIKIKTLNQNIGIFADLIAGHNNTIISDHRGNIILYYTSRQILPRDVQRQPKHYLDNR